MPSRSQRSAKERDARSRVVRQVSRNALLRGSLVVMHRQCGAPGVGPKNPSVTSAFSAASIPIAPRQNPLSDIAVRRPSAFRMPQFSLRPPVAARPAREIAKMPIVLDLAVNPTLGRKPRYRRILPDKESNSVTQPPFL
jgi:hypothetical protein